ncbi:hypothetical protein [Hymenobacter sp. UV11]|uniref:hypothetical protein n=1 Tax=Hymenobacter sp. UV11 TaxID=1849735 RepID=UPI00196A881B|nr:hypothetical protein [Hymenobacter sp. UV11]
MPGPTAFYRLVCGLLIGLFSITATYGQSVAAGSSHTVAVHTDGSLWAWGLNTYGQLGDGSTTNRTPPVQIGSATTWGVVDQIG